MTDQLTSDFSSKDFRYQVVNLTKMLANMILEILPLGNELGEKYNMILPEPVTCLDIARNNSKQHQVSSGTFNTKRHHLNYRFDRR